MLRGCSDIFMCAYLSYKRLSRSFIQHKHLLVHIFSGFDMNGASEG
jgi:hypothetical protein